VSWTHIGGKRDQQLDKYIGGELDIYIYRRRAGHIYI
jgi:hypothetical protein